MDEHKSPKTTPLLELIEQVLAGNASDEQMRQLDARLVASAEDRKLYLHRLNLHSALRRQFAYDAEEEPATQLEPVGGEQEVALTPPGATVRRARWPWAVVAAAVVVLVAAVYLQQPTAERPIAKITGLSGSLQWTGDGGRVLDELNVGTELPGGTVEGMTPGSWFELEFNDGSTVAISGNATLTFSDDGQKELHLKDGNLSGNVKPQPAGKPMLVYTRSALLEVLGTQFEVEAQLAATTLSVSQGSVRVKRFSDGNTVDVPARHRVVAAADREMLPLPVPDSVGRWKSRLHLGPNGGRGKWSPGSDTQDAKLEAIPYTTPRGVTIYTATFDLSRGDTPPVVLQRDSQVRVRGNLASSHSVYFGVTVRQADGEFAGRFQTVRPADEFPAGRDFEVVLSLQDYQLDPSLDDMKDKLPRVPFELVVESIWCHTLDQPAGLEIFEIELLSATASSTADQPTAQPPTVDIWTAASQGNLAAVRRHIASGADLNATVSAPGIPASGATPLHLSVLADRGEIAEVLIAGGADLGARAQDEHGGTPLHWAAALGRIEMAKRLVRLGADVNAPDSNGYTPLDATDYAPEYEPEAKARIAEFLREKGGVTK